jgi:hypothetical protein
VAAIRADFILCVARRTAASLITTYAASRVDTDPDVAAAKAGTDLLVLWRCRVLSVLDAIPVLPLCV